MAKATTAIWSKVVEEQATTMATRARVLGEMGVWLLARWPRCGTLAFIFTCARLGWGEAHVRNWVPRRHTLFQTTYGNSGYRAARRFRLFSGNRYAMCVYLLWKHTAMCVFSQIFRAEGGSLAARALR